jgi:transcription antitermination factor NusG
MAEQIATKWYAVRCATRQERRATDGLHQRGFDTYAPMETRWRHLRAVKDKIQRPLFPGYLFVRCTPGDFYDIGETDGVSQFVRAPLNGIDLEPLPFPDECIGDLMARQHFGEFDQTRKTPMRTRPKAGDRANVIGGKWRGYVAQVLSTSATKRKAIVLLETMHAGPVKMTLDVAHLDAA